MDLKYVGRKKIILIVILVAVAAASFLGTEFFLKEDLKKQERALSRTTNQFNELKNKNLSMEDDLIYLREREEDFKVLRTAGLFESQSTDLFASILNNAKDVSGVTEGTYRISAPECNLNEHFADSKYAISARPLTIDLQSYEDLSIYHFIDELIRAVPGYLTVNQIEIQRTEDVTRSVLQRIGTGETVPLINAKVDLVWYTILEKEEAGCS